MLQKAREKGFRVSAKVKMPKTVIHSYNLNVILGNLLENAIEAGEQAQEKILNVNICMKQGVPMRRAAIMSRRQCSSSSTW